MSLFDLSLTKEQVKNFLSDCNFDILIAKQEIAILQEKLKALLAERDEYLTLLSADDFNNPINDLDLVKYDTLKKRYIKTKKDEPLTES